MSPLSPILPQRHFSRNTQIYGRSYNAKSLEHSSHSRNGNAVTSFQTGNLCSLHTYAFTELLLGQILFYTGFSDGFAQTVSMQRFVHIAFKSITFGSADFSKVLVKYIV